MLSFFRAFFTAGPVKQQEEEAVHVAPSLSAKAKPTTPDDRPWDDHARGGNESDTGSGSSKSSSDYGDDTPPEIKEVAVPSYRYCDVKPMDLPATTTTSTQPLVTFGKLIHILESYLKNAELTYPTWVIIGMEASGKTSLINYLIGLIVGETGRERTTIRPTLYNLIRDPSDLIPHGSVLVELAFKGKTTEFMVDGSSGKALWDRIKEFTGDGNGNNVIDHVLLVVTVRGPDLHTISFIDLPGLVLACNEKKFKRQEIYDMVRAYVTKMEMQIILVHPAKEDKAVNSGALALLEEVAMKDRPDVFKHTIMVLTKPDLLADQDMDTNLVERLNLNSDFTVEHGIHQMVAVVNPQAKDRLSLPTARAREQAFFAKNLPHMSEEERARKTGPQAVFTAMDSVSKANIHSQVPVGKRRIKSQMKDKVQEYQKLGPHTRYFSGDELVNVTVSMLMEQLSGLVTMVQHHVTDCIAQVKAGKELMAFTQAKDGDASEPQGVIAARCLDAVKDRQAILGCLPHYVTRQLKGFQGMIESLLTAAVEKDDMYRIKRFTKLLDVVRHHIMAQVLQGSNRAKAVIDDDISRYYRPMIMSKPITTELIQEVLTGIFNEIVGNVVLPLTSHMSTDSILQVISQHGPIAGLLEEPEDTRATREALEKEWINLYRQHRILSDLKDCKHTSDLLGAINKAIKDLEGMTSEEYLRELDAAVWHPIFRPDQAKKEEEDEEEEEEEAVVVKHRNEHVVVEAKKEEEPVSEPAVEISGGAVGDA